MDDFTVPISVKLACSYWPKDRGFEDVLVEIDLKRDTVRDLKKKLDPASTGVNGFVIFYGQFLDDSDAFHNFYDGHVKLIVLDFGSEWTEAPNDASCSNLALRIIRGGFSPEFAVRALSRAVWHPGFDEFVKSAATLKKLTESSFSQEELYADRLVVPTVDSDAQRSICGVVRSNRTAFFPSAMQDLAAWHAAHDAEIDGPARGIIGRSGDGEGGRPSPSGGGGGAAAVAAARSGGGDDEVDESTQGALAAALEGCTVVPSGRRLVQRRKLGGAARASRGRDAARFVANAPTIEAAAAAVVRVFGMHPTASATAAGAAWDATRRSGRGGGGGGGGRSFDERRRDGDGDGKGGGVAGAIWESRAGGGELDVVGGGGGASGRGGDSGGAGGRGGASYGDGDGEAGAGGVGGEGAFTDVVLDAGMPTMRAVGFTGFFVAPRLIMTSLSGAYDPQSDTYATSFRFTRNVHASYYSLCEGTEVFDCEVVHDVPDAIVAAIRRTGISLPDADVPPSFSAASWKDVLLLHVRDAAAASPSYLAPDPAAASYLSTATPVAVPFYPSRPDPSWLAWLTRPSGGAAFKDGLSPLAPLVSFSSDDVHDVFHGYESLVVAPGETLARKGSSSADALDSSLFLHTAPLCPGAIGAPIIALQDPPDQWLCGDPPVPAPPVVTFVGIVTGRSRIAYLNGDSNVYGMSQSLVDSRQGAMGMAALSGGSGGGALGAPSMKLLNGGVPVTATWLAFVIETFVVPPVTAAANAGGRDSSAALTLGILKKWAAQFRVVFDAERLAVCHEKMVRDADALNEYGMDFYERALLSDALICFREGARMFSLATIPNLTEYEEKLKLALQANVSSVLLQIASQQR